MTRKTKIQSTRRKTWKINHFTLHREEGNKWKVSGRDLDGAYRRIRFEAEDLETAVKAAKERMRSPVSPADEFPVLQIADALIRAAQNRNWNEVHRKSDARNCELFLRWVDSKGLRYWHELRFEHVEEYQSLLIQRGLAFDTIRLYLWPVRRTARWIASNWPGRYVNICENLRLSRHRVQNAVYNEETGNPVLTVAEVLDFLEFIHGRALGRKLSASIALQGLMGLRLQEALRLTWDKVNFDQGTVVVDGKVKNCFSVRCLPCPEAVQWLLRRKWETSRSEEAPEITPGYSDYRHYSSAVKKLLHHWRPGIRIKPKDLRNTLPTAALEGGWHSVYVERYIGHSPRSITERHYHGNQGKRLIRLYREKVAAFIDEEAQAWKAERNSKILPQKNVIILNSTGA
ncbi:MAG: site-specific integrase [Candidatus Omnitrophica bacterium]|nr:site-specific integrase [Candidatus Omnitrophota bacterium]